MKISYLGALVLVVIIVFFGVISLKPNIPADVTQAPEITDTENSVVDEEHEEMAEDDHMADPDSEEGTDVGMEMPIPDADTFVEEMIVAEASTYEVTGTNFAFDVTEIRVKKGETVTINFISADGFHDWVVDEFSAKTDRVNTGGRTSVTFVADQTGTFEYYCSVGSHRAKGMVGKLIVE